MANKDNPTEQRHQKLDTSKVSPYEACGEAPFSKNLREGVKIDLNEINEVRSRLNAGALNDEDVAFLDGLISKTLREVRALSGNRVFETLPNGMDIIK